MLRDVLTPVMYPLMRDPFAAAVSSRFNPVSMAPTLWLDPSDLATLFTTSAGTTPVTADGDHVGLMLDKSGYGKHATQTTDALRVRYRTDGTYHWLDRGAAGTGFLNLPASVFTHTTSFSIVGGFKVTDSNGFPAFIYPNPTVDGVYLGCSGLERLSAVTGGAVGSLNQNTGSNVLNVPATVSLKWVSSDGSLSSRKDGVTEGVSTGTPGTVGAPSTYCIVGHPLFANVQVNFYGMVITGDRALSLAEEEKASVYIAAKHGVSLSVGSIAFALGDSTIAAYAGGSSIFDLMTSSFTESNLAVPGASIAAQQSTWSAVSNKSAAWVIIQVGLNDLDAGEAASVAISRLQTLVNTVYSTTPLTTKILISKMLPCKQRLIDSYGGVNGLISQQKWVDINEAIAGNGPTPITNVAGRITSHVPSLDDGAGSLAPAYDTGDEIHPNNAGRQIIADAWVAGLTAIGATV